MEKHPICRAHFDWKSVFFYFFYLAERRNTYVFPLRKIIIFSWIPPSPLNMILIVLIEIKFTLTQDVYSLNMLSVVLGNEHICMNTFSRLKEA